MKARLIPAIAGLSVALLFSFNQSIILSHIMYFGAACLLYREIIYMSIFSPHEKSTYKALLVTGYLALFFYAVAHAFLLRSDNPNPLSHNSLLGLAISRYEVGSAFIFLYTTLCFLLPQYVISVFTQTQPTLIKNTQKQHSEKNSTSTENPFIKRFQHLLIGLHALFYSTFFLYSIVKIKYSYLYVTHSALTVNNSLTLLLLIWILVWLYDSMAYLGGTLWGTRKLGLQVSPQKSWVGLYLGTLSLATVLLLLNLFRERMFLKELKTLWFFQTFWHLLLFTGIIVIAAQLGDLIASFFKRAVQIKDSGTLFGSHGGFLDRNDSSIFTFTLFYQILLLTT